MTGLRPGEPLVNNFKIPSWYEYIEYYIVFGLKGKQASTGFTFRRDEGWEVDSVLVWHKFLNRAFLIDLGSAHGTFIGKIRLEAHKPQQVPLDSELHFGASTRVYVIRERPNPLYNGSLGNSESGTANTEGTNPMGPENRSSSSFMDDPNFGSNSLLPQSEVELDNLTEFNTAHNRRIASIVDVTSNSSSLGLAKSGKRKHYNVHFSDADEVINPEDVDPSIGRFRNLVQETFIPNKRAKGSHEGAFLGVAAPETPEQPIRTMNTTVRVVPNGAHTGSSSTNSLMSANALFGPTYSLAAKLGLPLPNLAPEIESEPREPTLPPTLAMLHAHAHSRPGTLTTSLPDGRQTGRLSASDILGTDADGQIGVVGLESGLVEPEFPKRKKYAKEAWPGKRPGFLVGPTA
ncbi:nuclear inhibitor of protein phosphatase 1 [Paragonimus westermani]|uniref:Nuclear inhibitor of protein phosphatase 1 n=1 Tax=Paragonimus westermani TaxID=34504 RepID=A0A5J4NI09_9TREM|nr:nuclear inhibitor of protein phosphatase 1 [Paragonimus westermani]